MPYEKIILSGSKSTVTTDLVFDESANKIELSLNLFSSL